MKISRLDVLRRLVERLGYTSYLEIGVAGGATFKHVPVADKTGVDPKWRLWYLLDRRIKKTTSDRFFAANRRRFDLVFIDGWHVAEQAWRDLSNALAALAEGGTVLLHDCSPESEEQQRVPRVQVSWTGDVWRAFLKAAQDPGLETVLLDTNRGCGLVRRRPRPPGMPAPPLTFDPLDRDALSWSEYAANRHRWLRIHPPDEVLAIVDEWAGAKPEGA